jgi:hypothetical protein
MVSSFTKMTVAVLIVTNFVSTRAFAYCSEPTAPDPPSSLYLPSKPSKPSVPFCVNELMKTHTCSDWEISSHNSDIDSYNSAMQNYSAERDEYIRKLKNFVDEAQAFSNGALDYAKCKIRFLD